jgi:hypothetical protein
LKKYHALHTLTGGSIDEIEALGLFIVALSAAGLFSSIYLDKYPSVEKPVDKKRLDISWEKGYQSGLLPTTITEIDYSSQLYALGFNQGYKEVTEGYRL